MLVKIKLNLLFTILIFQCPDGSAFVWFELLFKAHTQNKGVTRQKKHLDAHLCNQSYKKTLIT